MSGLKQLQKQLRLTAVFILCLLMAGLLLPENLSSIFIDEATAGKGGPVPRYGYIMTRGIERTEAGNPIWAEIDVDGSIVSEIAEATGEYGKAKPFGVSTYLSIVQAFNNFKEQNEDGIAKGAIVMTRDEYQKKQFANVDVPKVNVAQDDPNKTESVPIPKLQLRDSTNTVYVRSEESVIDPRLLPTKGAQRGMILFESEIDLRVTELQEYFSDEVKSLLLSEKGTILVQSNYNIGYKTHFFKKDDNGNEIPLGPVAGAHVDAGIYSLNLLTAADETGKYGLTIFIPPCPGFSFQHDYNIWAKVFYSDFDPESPIALGYYYYRSDDYYMCSDLAASLQNSGSLSGLMTGLAVSAIESGIGEGIYRHDFYVDLLKFGGISYLSNEGSPIPFGATEYEYTAPPKDKAAPQSLDLNLDRVSDVAVNASDTRYFDIYLDGQTTNPDGTPKEADLQRVADVAPDFTDQGLLKSISIEDMKETDIYIYRVSNGKIVVKKKGLREKEIIESGVGFAYDLVLPGPLDDLSDGLFNTLAGKTEFQEAAGYPPEMIGRKADFLRHGEEVKIIAINRPTGYIGSVNTTVHTPIDGTYSVKISDLVMRPPNLKVNVERVYSVEAGMTKDEQKEYKIGFEGGALTTDTRVSISTEWFDHDGSPLPTELEGYTGRLAKVTGKNSLSGGDVNTFSIKPGSNLQVVTFAGDILGTEHLYVHVSGYPEWRNPGIGAGDGPLAFRPKHYVPIKAPIFDEVATRKLRDFNRYNKQDEVPTALDQVDAVYQWPYRPEMQFSVYDLKIKNITRTKPDDTQVEVYNETIPGFATGDQNINFVYNLFQKTFGDDQSVYDGLALLGADKDLIFAFGEHEILATFGEDQTIKFENLASFGQLSPEDYLSIRLYQNNDAENILWEFAFEYLDFYALIDDDILPSEEDGAIEISADNTEVDLVAHLIGFANRLDEDKYEVVVNWKKDGVGSLTKYLDKDKDYAIFRNKLTLPTYTGASAEITANLTLDQGAAKLAAPLKFRVVPGEPSTLTLGPDDTSSQLYVGEEGNVTLKGEAKDQFGNLVADGTAVTITTDGSVKIVEQAESTIDGAFTVVIAGTDFVELGQITAKVGDISETINLDVHAVDIAFAGLPTSVNVNGKTNFTVNVTAGGEPVSDYTLDVWADNGARLTTSIVKTDANGQAQLTLIAPKKPSSINVKAMAAMQVPAQAMTVNVIRPSGGAGPEPSLDNERTKMIGDATAESIFTYTRWDETVFNINKPISGNIVALGNPGESVTLNIGDIFSPNRLTQAAYWMNDLGTAVDETGFSNGVLENVTLSNDTRQLAGNSYQFTQSGFPSRVKVPVATRVQLTNDNSFVVDIKPSVYTGQVFNLGNGLILELLANNTLRLTANTTTGSFTAANTTILSANNWHQVAGSFSAGTLTLAVGDERINTPVTGDLVYSKITTVTPSQDPELHDLVLGEGYEGLMKSLKWFNLASAPLTTFDNNLETTTVTIAADGKFTVPVNSKGIMLSYGSKLPMQGIAITANQDRQTIDLLSTAAFEAMAGSTISGGLVAGAPAFNLAALRPDSVYAQTTSSLLQTPALFPSAHAYDIGFWDVVDIISSLVGLDSLGVIWDQVGNLIAGREVDIVALTLAILDVLTLFPPALPLKPIVKTAQVVVKLLRLGNTRAVQFLGGVIKKMYQKAKGRDFTLVFQGIAFFIVTVDMVLDPESRDGIVEIAKMINSTDDFLDIMDFISIADDEITLPDSTASLMDNNPLQQYAGLKYGLFPQANAAVFPGAGVIIGKIMKKLAPKIAVMGKAAPKTLGELGRGIKKSNKKYLKDAAFSDKLIQGVFSFSKRVGISQIGKLLTSKHRMGPITLIAIIAYLETELEEGRLFSGLNNYYVDHNKIQLRKLYIKSIPAIAAGGKDYGNLIKNAHGAQFQLLQIGILHAMSQGGDANSKVVGIEVPRLVPLLKKPDDLTKAIASKTYIPGSVIEFTRDIDIVTGSTVTNEIWREMKSYKSKGLNSDALSGGITPWDWGSGSNSSDNENDQDLKGSSTHRQYILDRVASETFARVKEDSERSAKGLANDKYNVTVKDIYWHFHKFKTKSSKNPGIKNITTAFDKDANSTPAFYKSHVAKHKDSTFILGSIDLFLTNSKSALEDAVRAEVAERLDTVIEGESVQ